MAEAKQAGAVMLLILDEAITAQIKEDAKHSGRSFEQVVHEAAPAARPQPILLDEQTVTKLNELAQTTGRSLADVIREHLTNAVHVKETGSSFLQEIAGLGASGESDVSERVEEILAAEADPIEGFQIKHDQPKHCAHFDILP